MGNNANEVAERWEKLQEAEAQLLGDELMMLKRLHPLRDIHDMSEEWDALCDSCLKRLAAAPEEAPLSARADSAHNNAQHASRACISMVMAVHASRRPLRMAVEELTVEMTKALRQLRDNYNGLLTRVRKGKRPLLDGQRSMLSQLYQACYTIDPRNSDLANTRKQVESVGINLED